MTSFTRRRFNQRKEIRQHRDMLSNPNQQVKPHTRTKREILEEQQEEELKGYYTGYEDDEDTL